MLQAIGRPRVLRPVPRLADIQVIFVHYKAACQEHPSGRGCVLASLQEAGGAPGRKAFGSGGFAVGAQRAKGQVRVSRL